MLLLGACFWVGVLGSTVGARKLKQDGHATPEPKGRGNTRMYHQPSFNVWPSLHEHWLQDSCSYQDAHAKHLSIVILVEALASPLHLKMRMTPCH